MPSLIGEGNRRFEVLRAEAEQFRADTDGGEHALAYPGADGFLVHPEAVGRFLNGEELAHGITPSAHLQLCVKMPLAQNAPVSVSMLKTRP